MRRFFVSLFTLTYLLSFPHFSTAQTQASDDTLAKVQEMAQWTQSYYAIMENMVFLFNNGEIAAALSAIETDDLETIASSARAYGQIRSQTLDQVQNAMSDMPSMPTGVKSKDSASIQINKSLKALMVMRETLPAMYDEIAVSSGHVETMLRRLSKGDYSGISEIAKQQNAASIRLLEAENMQAEAAILAVKDDNPNHHFQRNVLAINKIFIEELKLENLTYDGSTTLEDRQVYNQRIKRELDKIPDTIAKGRQTQELLTVLIKKETPLIKAENMRKFNEAVIVALGTFSNTFDIEQEVYDLSLQAYSEYTSDKLSVDFETLIEELDTKRMTLFQQRADIMSYRISLLSQ